MGMLSIFNRSSPASYTNPVDRVPGHPSSIDALINLTDDVIATGSSDGMIRLVQILPSKLLGVVADHGDFPVERLALSRDGKWLASASHDEILKLTDIGDALVESDEEMDSDAASEVEEVDSDDEGEEAEPIQAGPAHEVPRIGSKRAASLSSSQAELQPDDELGVSRSEVPRTRGPASTMTAGTVSSLQWRSASEKVPKGKDKKRMKQDMVESASATATTFFADL